MFAAYSLVLAVTGVLNIWVAWLAGFGVRDLKEEAGAT
jgi:hypothetical protein